MSWQTTSRRQTAALKEKQRCTEYIYPVSSSIPTERLLTVRARTPPDTPSHRQTSTPPLPLAHHHPPTNFPIRANNMGPRDFSARPPISPSPNPTSTSQRLWLLDTTIWPKLHFILSRDPHNTTSTSATHQFLASVASPQDPYIKKKYNRSAGNYGWTVRLDEADVARVAAHEGVKGLAADRAGKYQLKERKSSSMGLFHSQQSA